MECPADVYVRMYKQASVQDKGGLGACTTRKFLEIRCSDIASEAILDQKQSCSSYMARHFLAVRVVTSWLLIFTSSIGKDYYYI